MTRTVHVSLGTSPLSGRHALDMTQRFKEQLNALAPKPGTVALLTVTDTETHACSVVAVYDADDPPATAWVGQARELADELWQKLAERRKGVGSRHGWR